MSELPLAACIAVLLLVEPFRGFDMEAIGQEPSKNSSSDRNPRQIDYAHLIDTLANSNPPPTFAGDEEFREVIFPENYNWSEQSRVVKAIDQISEHPQEAWSFLVDHLDDNRYCITLGREDPNNTDVGTVCGIIVRDSLAAAYMPHIPPTEACFFQLFRPDVTRSDDFNKWIKEQQRMARPLFELQVEMCEWAIKKIDELTKTKIDDAPIVTKEERDTAAAKIRQQIADLRSSKTPVPMNGFMQSGIDRIPSSRRQIRRR